MDIMRRSFSDEVFGGYFIKKEIEECCIFYKLKITTKLRENKPKHILYLHRKQIASRKSKKVQIEKAF